MTQTHEGNPGQGATLPDTVRVPLARNSRGRRWARAPRFWVGFRLTSTPIFPGDLLEVEFWGFGWWEMRRWSWHVE